ncbi:MAG: hypothetical protein ACJ759_01760 [Thermoanaerobaculia bacterium]
MSGQLFRPRALFRPRVLFRPRALAAWAERRELSVLPRLATPRVLAVLWMALALLLGAGAALLIVLLRGAGA